ncbi:MAG: hypothetical protein D6820_13240 [Lentisphaerae bacterium]|nr:MAG: hypothetical protein D6820_13240 [Lentisphaerota bacterium]
MTGTYPAVYGWDFCDIHNPRLRQHATAILRRLIIEAFERGGVNTISWHMNNPITGRRYNDCKADTVSRILPGGDRHALFRETLDWAAVFSLSLRAPDGTLVPVIFRPWHEHTHDGFWWNLPYCGEEDYVHLWRFTVHYLRDIRHVHNLLYAYASSGRCIKVTEATYLQGYAGDDCVDILGLDNDMDNPKRSCRGRAGSEIRFQQAQNCRSSRGTERESGRFHGNRTHA